MQSVYVEEKRRKKGREVHNCAASTGWPATESLSPEPRAEDLFALLLRSVRPMSIRCDTHSSRLRSSMRVTLCVEYSWKYIYIYHIIRAAIDPLDIHGETLDIKPTNATLCTKILLTGSRQQRGVCRLAESQQLDLFIQKLLGLVDLGREIRAPAAIGVVEEHELAVLLANLVFVEGALTAAIRTRTSHGGKLAGEGGG